MWTTLNQPWCSNEPFDFKFPSPSEYEMDYYFHPFSSPNNNVILQPAQEMMKSSKSLTKEMISEYFYMPITQAAKELNVGLTLLKKKCRELGIRRWPHRKLMSLQTLIKNVQEMEGGGGEMNGGKLREAIQILEREKKLMEDMPDLKMEDRTKRLRQACFKANYKKRKIINTNNNGATDQDDQEDEDEYEDEDEDEAEDQVSLSSAVSI